MWVCQSERQAKGLSADFAAREFFDAIAMGEKDNECVSPEIGTRTRRPHGDGGGEWGLGLTDRVVHIFLFKTFLYCVCDKIKTSVKA